MSRGRAYSTVAAAEYCGMATKSLRNLLSLGKGPRRYKQGALNAFFQEDLDAWLESRITEAA